MTVLLLAVAAATSVTAAVAAVSNADWRALENGVLVLEDLYLDQTGVVVVPQPGQPGRARWVMTITRNSLPEGNRGEHVECLYSDDAGATWSTPAKLEPGAGTPGGLTHAYSAILAADFGRLYVTYSLNLYNVTRFPDGTPFTRDDTLGQYVARWSDDSGATWSPERILLPLRTTAIDRGNDPFNGAVMLFWSVDVPKRRPDGDNATVFLGFSKLGAYMGTGDVEEAFIMASPNLATERNVSKIVWNTLPDGDTGITSSAPRLWRAICCSGGGEPRGAALRRGRRRLHGAGAVELRLPPGGRHAGPGLRRGLGAHPPRALLGRHARRGAAWRGAP